MKGLLQIFLLVLVCCILACNAPVEQSNSVAKPALSISNLDTSKLQSGDIVLRLGNDITSNMLAQMNTSDKRFSHIGFCFKEDDNWMVYHALAAEFGEEKNMRKEPLEHFFNSENNLSIGIAFTNFNHGQRALLYQKVQQWQQAKIPFDMAFDLNTDDKLYCSEMVAKAINYSLDSNFIPFSDTLNKQFYGIDDIIHSSLIEKVQFQTISKLAIHRK